MKKIAKKKFTIKANVKEFNIPPIRDCVIIGHLAPIGSAAIKKSLELLVTAPFEHIVFKDDVIGDILIRQALLKRVPKEKLMEFILGNIKPIMVANEIMQIDLEAEVLIEEDSM